MASWPVSASNLLRDIVPITSEKKWPGLYIIYHISIYHNMPMLAFADTADTADTCILDLFCNISLLTICYIKYYGIGTISGIGKGQYQHIGKNVVSAHPYVTYCIFNMEWSTSPHPPTPKVNKKLMMQPTSIIVEEQADRQMDATNLSFSLRHGR